MHLFDHQKKLIALDPKKTGIFWGTGSAKTRTALLLARGKTLVVMPKIQYTDDSWNREVKKINLSIDLTCVSKEQFRAGWEKFPRYDTVIIDECHTVTGLTPGIRWRKKMPIPLASQLFEAVQNYLKAKPPERLYLLSATPARNPMNVLALAWLLGKDWDFYKFRAVFYIKLPMPGREVWSPKKDAKTKEHLAKLVKSLGVVGRLQDYFDVPEQTTRYIHCPLTKEQEEAIEDLPLMFPDPLVLTAKTHQVEQGFLIEGPNTPPRSFKTAKFDAIEDILEEYDKVLIFARYKEQIRQLEGLMAQKKIKTFVLTGDTKDRKTLMSDAEKESRCVFICQAQISTGFELPSFRCTLFASCSYSSVDHTQALGRTLRANALNKNLYVYLHSGEVDKAVLDCLENHKDFDEKLFAKKYTQGL